MVKAFFLSLWDYGDVIYIHAALSTLKPLDAVYHFALRFITSAYTRSENSEDPNEQSQTIR